MTSPPIMRKLPPNTQSWPTLLLPSVLLLPDIAHFPKSELNTQWPLPLQGPTEQAEVAVDPSRTSPLGISPPETVLDNAFYSSKCLRDTVGQTHIHISPQDQHKLQIFLSKFLKRKRKCLTGPVICKLSYYYNQFFFLKKNPFQIRSPVNKKQTVLLLWLYRDSAKALKLLP